MNRLLSPLVVIACVAVAGLVLSLSGEPDSAAPVPGICDYFPYWPGCP
ncbi:MAG: hypothetical protein K4304_07220 [Propionicimonas sp.]